MATDSPRAIDPDQAERFDRYRAAIEAQTTGGTDPAALASIIADLIAENRVMAGDLHASAALIHRMSAQIVRLAELAVPCQHRSATTTASKGD